MPVVEKIVNGKKGKCYKVPEIRGWNELVEEISLPASMNAIYVAIMTNRPELLTAYKPEPGDAVHLVNLCRVLMATNRELAEHSQYLSERMETLDGLLDGFTRGFAKLVDTAAFRSETEGDDSED